MAASSGYSRTPGATPSLVPGRLTLLFHKPRKTGLNIVVSMPFYE